MGDRSGMRVVVPYVPGGLGLGVAERLLNQGWSPRFVNVAGSDTAYWELLADLWAAKVDFCVVEQDIVVNADTLDSFEACEEVWCGAAYPYLGGTYVGLGCVRFRAELMRLRPDVMNLAGEFTNATHCRRHWCTTDHALIQQLGGHGRVCRAHGVVEHLGDKYPSHECCRPVDAPSVAKAA